MADGFRGLRHDGVTPVMVAEVCAGGHPLMMDQEMQSKAEARGCLIYI